MRRLATCATGAALVLLLAACGGSALEPDVTPSTDEAASSPPAADEAGVPRIGTCWTPARVGDDPQDALQLARDYEVEYAVAAAAVAERWSFTEAVSCETDHQIEVFATVELPDLDGRLASYGALLRTNTKVYEQVARTVPQKCMTPALAEAAKTSKVPNVVAAPALPAGQSVSWVPAPPGAWAEGSHVFLCTFVSTRPTTVRYADVFTAAYPTASRTCIDSQKLIFVDCARKHDRERIAAFDVTSAVADAKFPGAKAITTGPDGTFVDLGKKRLKRLDAACTAYLKAISTTKKLTGVAQVDVATWPAANGRYRINCEADRPPTEESIVTSGTVYDRS